MLASTTTSGSTRQVLWVRYNVTSKSSKLHFRNGFEAPKKSNLFFIQGFFTVAQCLGQILPAIHSDTFDTIDFFPLWICRLISSFRAVVVVLILFTCTPAVHYIHSSFAFLWFVGLMSFTGGIVQTATFMVAPTLAKAAKQPDAGSVCLLLNFLGMAFGLGLAVPYVDILIPKHGVVAVCVSGGVLLLLPWFSSLIVMFTGKPNSRARRAHSFGMNDEYQALSAKTN